jgi:hypothetical protein
MTADAIKTRLAADCVDVDAFIGTLVDLKLAQCATAREPDHMAPETAHGWLRWATPLARVLFSWPCAIAYLAVVVCGIASIIAEPSILPDRSVFFFDHDRTFSFLALVAMGGIGVTLHELGHILAAARLGLGSRIGVGTRLWTIVLETDLTGLFSLPRSRRYVPLLAGLAVDALNVSLMFVVLAAMVRGHASADRIHLIKALVSQTSLIMLWQTNVFLRTDLYYVLCTCLGFPDLDRDARRYLGALTAGMARFSPGALRHRLAAAAATCEGGWHLRTVQLFSLVWITGRIISIYVLLFVLIPTLAAYVIDNYRAISGTTAQAIPYDSICFSSLAVCLTTIGVGAWIFQNRPRVRQ